MPDRYHNMPINFEFLCLPSYESPVKISDEKAEKEELSLKIFEDIARISLDRGSSN